MEIKKLFSFLVIFVVLIGFTAASLGVIDTRTNLESVAAAKELNSRNSVSFSEPLSQNEENFFDKILRFLRREVVCEVTVEQQAMLEASYDTELQTFDVDGETHTVLIINNNPINRNIIEQTLGEELGECIVVHGNHRAALLTSMFVS